ncbi:MAG: cytochrome c maturation protein CcmE [Pseudomonadota bacterium]
MAAGLKKRRRMQIAVIATVLLAVATALVIVGARDAFQFFRSPAQIAEDPPRPGERFRLGGVVKAGTWQQGDPHEFVVTDFDADFPVRYRGILPDLFREGQGTIVTGQIEGGVFVATEVLARHDEDYMPRELADALKDRGVYRDGEVTPVPTN